MRRHAVRVSGEGAHGSRATQLDLGSNASRPPSIDGRDRDARPLDAPAASGRNGENSLLTCAGIGRSLHLNEIGGAGAMAISEALKTNSALEWL